jgi:polyisoprenoid-binding protein YceI
MRTLLILIACFVATMLPGQQNTVLLTENGTVGFVSEAPLEIIKASSVNLKGAIDTEKQSFVFVLENQSFKGFNSPLQQEHFYENYLETAKYPKTTFTGRIIEPLNIVPGTEQTVRAKGILDLHGVKQERMIKAVVKYEEESMSISATFTVLLDDHQIRIPKVVSKKISPEIRVSIEAVLYPNKP